MQSRMDAHSVVSTDYKDLTVSRYLEKEYIFEISSKADGVSCAHARTQSVLTRSAQTPVPARTHSLKHARKHCR